MKSFAAEVPPRALVNGIRLSFSAAVLLGIACSGVSNVGFREVGTFHAPNMHTLYPSSAHFVVASTAAIVDQKQVLAYGRHACAPKNEQVCFVFFWIDESRAAKGFPITDEQSRAIVASYSRNRSTGNDGLQCYNFETSRAGRRCGL